VECTNSSFSAFVCKSAVIVASVLDQHRFDADLHLDPNFHDDANPDPNPVPD
jgi:hypothetical protein